MTDRRGQIVLKGGRHYILSQSGFLPVSFETASEITKNDGPINVEQVEKVVKKLEKENALSSPEPEDIFKAIEKSLGMMSVSSAKKK